MNIKTNLLYVWHLLCLILATVSIVIFWPNTTLVSLLLLTLAFLINLKSDKLEIIYYVIIAISATVLESVTISTGAWIYSHPQFLNFPIWLPLYWGIGGFVMKDVYLIIKQFSIGRQEIPTSNT